MQKYVPIGAFEHFAKPEASHEEKLGIYCEFCQLYRSWLHPGGALTLLTVCCETITQARMGAFVFLEDFSSSALAIAAPLASNLQPASVDERTRAMLGRAAADAGNFAASASRCYSSFERQRNRLISERDMIHAVRKTALLLPSQQVFRRMRRRGDRDGRHSSLERDRS